MFTSVAASHNLTKVNKRSLSMYLEYLVPGNLKEVRFNSLKNVVAIDTVGVVAVETLLHVTST